MDKVELEQLSDEELDDLVHDVMSQQASDLNNEGRDAQIDFILNNTQEV